MAFNTIISAQELAKIVGNEDVRVFDCRFSLKDPEGGLKAYQSGHIAGAQRADMDTQLSSAMTETSGRHPIPQAEVLAEQLRVWGVSKNTQVIAYDDMFGAFGSRLWWLLRWLGHENVAVLDGGLKTWQEAGMDLVTDEASYVAGDFQAAVNDAWVMDVDSVEAQLAAGEITLVDARPADRFTGKDQQTDPVPGHVPGAQNLPFGGNLTSDGKFQSAEALNQRFAEVIPQGDVAQLVNMCGSGVTACHNLLAQKIAGYQPARLFIGSWSQWIRDPKRAVVTDV